MTPRHLVYARRARKRRRRLSAAPRTGCAWTSSWGVPERTAALALALRNDEWAPGEPCWGRRLDGEVGGRGCRRDDGRGRRPVSARARGGLVGCDGGDRDDVSIWDLGRTAMPTEGCR